MGLTFAIQVWYSNFNSCLGFRFGIQVWDSSLGLRFGIQVLYSNGVSGLRFRLGIKVWDSFQRLKFGICFCCSCLGFVYAVLDGIQVLDTGLVLMFGVQVWIQVRD